MDVTSGHAHVYNHRDDLIPHWSRLRPARGKVVFTNGCFDILHAGHVGYLEQARALGDLLVLGLNSDGSVRRLKGETRPLNTFADRARVLIGLAAVDLVVGFEEDTPLQLIEALAPDVLVKGGDWSPHSIVGAEFVTNRGGLVRSLPFKTGRSTTGLVERILARHPAS